MTALIMWMMIIGTLGMLAGSIARTTTGRVICTIVFAVAWFFLIADRGRGLMLWMAWGVGLIAFLVGLWITSRIQRAMTLDNLADTTTEELLEGLLTLIDLHGEGSSEWLQHEWLAWPYETQRGWVRQHRSTIKRELASAARAGGFNPTEFWERMETLENYSP